MSDIVEKLAQANHLTPKEVEKINRRVDEFIKAAESDPELMESALEKLGIFGAAAKKGGKGGVWETFKRTLPIAGITAGTSALLAGATGVAQDAVHSAKESMQKSRAYKAMLEQEGESLAEIPAEKTQQAFNTLYRYNPDFAQDPSVAASFVRQTTSMAETPIPLVKQLVDARKAMSDLDRGRPSMSDFQSFVPKINLSDVE